MEFSNKKNVVIAIPVYNDWQSLLAVIGRLDVVFHDLPYSPRVLIVNDSSTEQLPGDFLNMRLHNILAVEILTLRHNLGHQRAIAIGLAYVEKNYTADCAVVMDGDGEDAPEDIPRLLREVMTQEKIIFAERKTRSEGLLFSIFYVVYKTFHSVMTGISINFGNFSALPKSVLSQLVTVSEFWNHYPAAIIKSKIPYGTTPIKRASRIAGESKMNFVSLIIHGLSAFSVQGEKIGVRLLIFSAFSMFFVFFGILAVLYIKIAGIFTVPGWILYLMGIIIALLLQVITLSGIFIFILLNNRTNISFIPIRDFEFFILKKEVVLERGR